MNELAEGKNSARHWGKWSRVLQLVKHLSRVGGREWGFTIVFVGGKELGLLLYGVSRAALVQMGSRNGALSRGNKDALLRRETRIFSATRGTFEWQKNLGVGR